RSANRDRRRVDGTGRRSRRHRRGFDHVAMTYEATKRWVDGTALGATDAQRRSLIDRLVAAEKQAPRRSDRVTPAEVRRMAGRPQEGVGADGAARIAPRTAADRAAHRADRDLRRRMHDVQFKLKAFKQGRDASTPEGRRRRDRAIDNMVRDTVKQVGVAGAV